MFLSWRLVMNRIRLIRIAHGDPHPNGRLRHLGSLRKLIRPRHHISITL